MEIEYRGQTYKNFIVDYEDGEPIKIELFKKGSHYSSEQRESIHTSPEKVKIITSEWIKK